MESKTSGDRYVIYRDENISAIVKASPRHIVKCMSYAGEHTSKYLNATGVLTNGSEMRP